MEDFASELRSRTAWLLLLFAVVTLASWNRAFALAPDQGPGGPILVVTTSTSPIGKYYAEILRTEGFQNFAVADVASVDATTLAPYDVVVLSKMTLTASQVTLLSNWVSGGGNLIAIAPDPQLAGLLGLGASSGTLADGYLRVDTSRAPGNGIYGNTMQFHGSATRYALAGATAVATLYANATSATTNPAVTLNSMGTGQAAAFLYDLATSIVQTRQGNPAWAAQERDGLTPIRSDDKFYGNATGDPQPDWVDLDNVAVPQADEQQRLLANLIVAMNVRKKPLPRFWYFPNGKKAVVVMTGDDHGNGGTAGRFDQFKAASPAGCDVAKWECIRGTSYIFPSTPLTNAQAAAYAADGFEISVHINTDCTDFTASSLESTYNQQLGDFGAKYTSIPAPSTERHHCIVWSDWASAAKTQLAHGMRLDLSYYYWPAGWVSNVPGLFTGSAMPMRLVDTDGSLIDVFEATTNMTDESGQTYPYTVDTLLDRAIGPEEFYGVYPINAHTDIASSAESDAVLASARNRSVPIVSSVQMLRWLDARNNSTFTGLAWDGATLRFSVAQDPAAIGLQALLPSRAGKGAIASITKDGTSVPFSFVTIKGIEYASFPAAGGAYVASYAADTTAPTITSKSPAASATGVTTFTTVSATFSEAIDPATISSSTFELRDAAGTLVPANVTYDAATRIATLTPNAPLSGSTSYTATLKGGTTDPRVKDLSGVALASTQTWLFTTGGSVSCPCSAFPSTATPAKPTQPDASPVELGVKLRVDVDGMVTGIRFYKGSTNTGTHIGNLWTSSGQRLATATFVNESASGWQQVNFAQPVAISANTVYVASYFAPAGNYSIDNDYFATKGVDNPPIHLLQEGVSGSNGVYAYGSTSGFPTNTYRSTNYWVDIVFTGGSGTLGGGDTTPPSVTSNSPANGASSVATTSSVSATFSEALDPSTITSTTFQLRDAANALVPGNVTYDASTRTATLTPASALAPGVTYRATVVGGTTDPRVKDLAGNALTSSVTWSFTTAQTSNVACNSPANAIVAENCLPGNPPSEWDVSGAGDPTIQGFATDISVDRGGTVAFKVKSTASAYRFDIYRLGYYAGNGARKVATVQPSVALPQTQPNCLNDATTGLIDCGTWAVSGTWTVPQTAVSGVYIARAVRTDTGGASHIVFVVRDDAGQSNLLFQTSDTTWQAYNDYGGNSLYKGGPGTNPARAYKVSYNRPFNTRAVDNGQDFLFNAEYPMIRWLESNGYDVSYTSGVDSDRNGTLIRNHKVFMSVGHDEYWSGTQRTNVETARNAGVNVAFFSGNEIFWKTRWENSIAPSATPYRTLVSYKETHANARIDPADPPTTTGTWLDPRFGPGGALSPTGDGGRPGNALAGTMYGVNDGASTSIIVPAADGRMRLWRNTDIATLAAGTSATLPNGTLGYEWDIDADNGSRPPGLVRNSTTTVPNAPMLQDFGSTYAPSTATHYVTFYRHASGARVFGAGTVQWSWGLDALHDRSGTPTDVRMQQATVNLLADMNAQPATPRSGLVAATASSDAAAPVSSIASPAAGSVVQSGGTVTITGTAQDTGGVVGGVEVSVDNGATWHPTTGRGSWSYVWRPSGSGTATVRSRAVDDSGNVETPGPGIKVTIGGSNGGTCPCTIWPATIVPANASAFDTNAVTLGVKFTADQSGFISGIRFYKGASNTGTHVGAVWTLSGQQLASATFMNETASGWQQVNFAQPVSIAANTVYIASYFAPNGGYAFDRPYFATTGVDAAPLHALSDGASGGNGVFVYGSAIAFPTSTYEATNYWVDVVYTPASGSDTTPPTVTATTPAMGAMNVSVTSSVSATFSEAINASTLTTSTFELRDSANGLVASTVAYDPATFTASLKPTNALTAGATYQATLHGGSTDPRIKDAAGNALASNVSWSFTTASASGDTVPPTVTSTSPTNGAMDVALGTVVTATFSEALDASTVTTTTFQLLDQNNAAVPAVVNYDASTLKATLTPSNPLTPGATYRATLVGGASDPRIKDLAGNALAANTSWTFATAAPAPDTTPPTITSVTPGEDATGVNRNTKVTVRFSEALNPSSVSTSTVTLRDASNQLVAARVSLDATRTIATLDPNTALGSGRTYTVNVVGGTGGVADNAGNPLAVSKAWTFTTR